MFRKTTANTQMSLFDNPADLMGKRAVKKYEDPKAWFNQFYELVTSQIDESVFKPLFKEGNMGAPTASIRQLVAMTILKEGFGCSDEVLIEKCDYDLLTRRALGLIRLEDEAPSLDTYYLLRRRICDYADATGENLMETCFSRLTKFQDKGEKDGAYLSIFTINSKGEVLGRLRLDEDNTGDKGYPSFSIHNGKYYMSYYKGHGKASVHVINFKVK